MARKRCATSLRGPMTPRLQALSRFLTRVDATVRALVESTPTKTDRLSQPPSLPLPVQPPRHACRLLGQPAFTRSSGSHPHKGSLCLCAGGLAARSPGTPPRNDREPPPRPEHRVPNPAPPALILHKRVTFTPCFKDRQDSPELVTNRTPTGTAQSRHRR